MHTTRDVEAQTGKLGFPTCDDCACNQAGGATPQQRFVLSSRETGHHNEGLSTCFVQPSKTDRTGRENIFHSTGSPTLQPTSYGPRTCQIYIQPEEVGNRCGGCTRMFLMGSRCIIYSTVRCQSHTRTITIQTIFDGEPDCNLVHYTH